MSWQCGNVSFRIVIHGLMLVFASSSLAAEPASPAVVVRCAVIGGMTDTGLWNAISKRFEQETGIGVQVVVTGPKHAITDAFRIGDADLITMHACDTVINLVADGFGRDPQPWARNDLLIVGPPSDPAGIRGEKDAAVAFKKIIDSQAKLLVHQSLGTNEVLHDVLAAGELELNPEKTLSLPTDRHRQMLSRAAREGAYTLVGRIPFLNGKLNDAGLAIMVEGDRRLRRPYVVVVARSEHTDDPRLVAADRLAKYLREPATQAWLAEFGRGEFDDRPLFFPVYVPQATAPAP